MIHQKKMYISLMTNINVMNKVFEYIYLEKYIQTVNYALYENFLYSGINIDNSNFNVNVLKIIFNYYLNQDEYEKFIDHTNFLNIIDINTDRYEEYLIILEKIKKNPELLSLIKEQTEEMCKLAVSKDGRALKFVNNQTLEICEMAILRDGLYYMIKNSVYRNLLINKFRNYLKITKNYIYTALLHEINKINKINKLLGVDYFYNYVDNDFTRIVKIIMSEYKKNPVLINIDLIIYLQKIYHELYYFIKQKKHDIYTYANYKLMDNHRYDKELEDKFIELNTNKDMIPYKKMVFKKNDINILVDLAKNKLTFKN